VCRRDNEVSPGGRERVDIAWEMLVKMLVLFVCAHLRRHQGVMIPFTRSVCDLIFTTQARRNSMVVIVARVETELPTSKLSYSTNNAHIPSSLSSGRKYRLSWPFPPPTTQLTEGSNEAAYPCRYKKGAASPSVPSCAALAPCKPYVYSSAANLSEFPRCSCCSLPILSVLLDGQHLPIIVVPPHQHTPTPTHEIALLSRRPVGNLKTDISSQVGIQYGISTCCLCMCNKFGPGRIDTEDLGGPGRRVSVVSPSQTGN
jgi:hypothetical protein